MLQNTSGGIEDFPPFRYNVTVEVIAMATVRFKLPIGAKRQVTIPSKAMELLSLHQGDDLLLEIAGDRAVLLPAVSVPRHELPEELKKKFLSRRGPKPTDLPLDKFLEEMGQQREKAKRQATAAHSATDVPRRKPRRPIAPISSENPIQAKA